MKKALLVTTVSGFVPQFEMKNVENMQEMGYEIHYASNYNNPSYGGDNSRLDGVDIVRHQVDFVRSPFKIKKNIIAYRQLCRVFAENQFELVHCHTPMGAILGRLAARESRKKGTKVFYTAHGFHFYKGAPIINWLLYYPIERFMMRYTDVLFTITKEDYKRAQSFPRKEQQRVYYVPGVGIDIDKFYVKEKRRLKNDKKIIMLSVGELNKNKNHRIIIDALHRINDSRLEYWICGKGPLENELKKLVIKYDMEKNVKFWGYCTDIDKFLQKADVFVFPSLREGLSVALQEAMAAGLPAIVSDIRGNRELIDEAKGGWRVNPNNVKQWQQCILNLLHTDIYSMGKYNQAKIKNYSSERIKGIMKEIYQETLLLRSREEV